MAPLKTTPASSDRGVLNTLYSEPGVSGNVYYVHHTGGTTGPGSSPHAAFATIDAAIGACTAGNGDVIVVLEGHAESISGASAITSDVAGVRIIGKGTGSNRPTVTWHTTDATWVISAANTSIENIRCTVDVDEVVKLFSVTGAWARLDRVDFFETASAQAIQFLLTTAAADDLEICNCRHIQVTAPAAATVGWIGLVGADRANIHDNTFILALKDDATSSVIGQATTPCLNIVIARNLVKLTGYSAATVAVFKAANTTTGLIADNRIGTDVAANTTIVDMAGTYSFNNLATNAVDTSGIIDPVADA